MSPPGRPKGEHRSAQREGRSVTETSDTPLARFVRSMEMDFEKWHDGIGYDLDALAQASPSERESIEALLVARAPPAWQDVEALAALATPRAHAALRVALVQGDAQTRAAVLRHSPDLADEDERTRVLVEGLSTGRFYGGLTQTLEQVEEFHPPAVIEALLAGTLAREGDVAVHYAAMLMYVHGRAKESFDWAQRPFFLRFNTEDPGERVAAFRELCARIGIAPEQAELYARAHLG